MRRLLTGGIKAILAIAALSTAAHWALRLQGDKPVAEVTGLASIPDPSATGSIVPRKIERAPSTTSLGSTSMPGLDQQHLLKLISDASTERPKLQKAVAKR